MKILVIGLDIPLLALVVLLIASARTSEAPPHRPETSAAWNLGNAAPWRRFARAQQLSLEDEDLKAGAHAYREALARNPLDPLAWEGLATVESSLRNDDAQTAALRGWISVVPHSPQASWALANLLIRRGETEEALPYFRRAAADEPSLRAPLFELSWKLLDDPRKILYELVPEDVASRQQYLYFLIYQKARLADAESVWQEIFKEKKDIVLPSGIRYVEALAAAGMGKEAIRVWNQLFPDFGSGGQRERIHNGGFERPLLGGGLEWFLTPGPGYEFALDDFEARSGSRALRIRFDGTTNPEFAAVRQWVVVEPNTDYDFSAAIKTDNLTTTNGVFISISSTTESQEVTTSSLSGSATWTEQHLHLRTGPRTHVLQLSVRRVKSTKLDNQLRGTVWIDSFSLRTSNGSD